MATKINPRAWLPGILAKLALPVKLAPRKHQVRIDIVSARHHRDRCPRRQRFFDDPALRLIRPTPDLTPGRSGRC